MKTLRDGRGELLEEPDYYGPRSLLTDACQAFPELRSDPDITIGTHVLMAAIGRLTMDAIAAENVDLARSILTFLDDVLRRPRLHPEIPNAVAISFIEPARFQASALGHQVWKSMPDSIRDLLITTDETQNES
jgi:hypothetical protein